MKTPYLIGIAGGSCSGKTTLLNHLAKTLPGSPATISLDDYYNWGQMTTIAPITRAEYPEHNHPDAVDTTRLYADIEKLISAGTASVIIIEGIFALHLDKLRDMLDLKIYVDLKSDERLYRRIGRMTDGKTMADTATRYLDTVRYRHDQFVEPSRWHADIVLNGTLDTHKGTEVVTSYVKSLCGL